METHRCPICQRAYAAPGAVARCLYYYHGYNRETADRLAFHPENVNATDMAITRELIDLERRHSFEGLAD